VEKTLSRYLSAIRAFVSESDFERTKAQVKKFLENKTDVEAIEAKLRERYENVENWVRV
jgi:hypothetical protein